MKQRDYVKDSNGRSLFDATTIDTVKQILLTSTES